MAKRRSVRSIRASGGRRRGAGFFGDLWSGVKNVFPDVVKGAWNGVVKPALQSSRILSNTVGKVPLIGSIASKAIADKGYGRKRGGRRMVRMGGGMPHGSLIRT